MQPIIVPKLNLILIVLLLGCFSASAQPDFTLPLVKPKKYENKVLGSEKTEDKKFTLPRRVYQSMVTHYNFFLQCHHQNQRHCGESETESPG